LRCNCGLQVHHAVSSQLTTNVFGGRHRQHALMRRALCGAGDVMTITMLLASLNSCVNPWIYVFFINNMRLSGIACRCCCCCCRCSADGRRTTTSTDDNARHLNDTWHAACHLAVTAAVVLFKLV